ncbi:hypothetical protein MAPG_06348 [Magnaporthiopsis poae ATCC 64411]|uniref:Uncharacterized protein n=1 Tax=Magnaporthiopsis poae (strain ATCC 64411 / 73-15) TaxID=644358 RepID=A0A0C4E1S9_MAGP6|nr:hypothetical protein MAPG_06348 [Magnaporthiopsis poae ATCC 64411]
MLFHPLVFLSGTSTRASSHQPSSRLWLCYDGQQDCLLFLKLRLTDRRTDLLREPRILVDDNFDNREEKRSRPAFEPLERRSSRRSFVLRRVNRRGGVRLRSM